MNSSTRKLRVLYSFPHKIGSDRICTTAWQQVDGLAKAGAEVTVFPGVLHKPFSGDVTVQPTLARGKYRIPFKLLGRMRALQLHDYIVSRRLKKLAGQIDIVHTWPVGAMETLRTARSLGIPTVLERPNAYTRFAYEVVRLECKKLGITMPPDHEHAFQGELLQREEAEYDVADYLLCPSDFVARTFLDAGYPSSKLKRHQYGFDERQFNLNGRNKDPQRAFTLLFVGGVAPRKGLHYALEAWLNSPAHLQGTFMVAGEFLPAYKERLAPMLQHPSIKLLGHRRDVQKLMQESDALVLPSIEEGSALVTSEARGCGCVLLVSEASGAICQHGKNALVHRVGDVQALTQHITSLYTNPALLESLRAESIRTVHEITWTAAGVKLLDVYRDIVANSAKLETDVPATAAPSAR
jgi:glycosyltransferase involved in cell wall biosynthesis